jgi:ubiquinone/menaquinone biosynthesis C-methylase UbiE
MREKIKQFLPKKITFLGAKLLKLIKYNNYDSSEYWKKRATESGQKAVMWDNQKYNSLYRKLQKDILIKYVSKMKSGERILDIGAGIGIVSNMLCEINEKILIDAVDFDEMIQVARVNIVHKQVSFISSSAEAFSQTDYKYQLILSSGCYSAIRDIQALEKSFENALGMLADDGILLMIDPFHRCNYLARAKYGSGDVMNFMEKRGIRVLEKSGVLFWPFREWLAGSSMDDEILEKRFIMGEKILRMLGNHFWSDYKILVFKK